ncbi:hypothetical protein GLOIN_2v1483996 [Rhizophagus clarus]|uniref:Uncharacterized protein n=1 Tax=Rhizophagus clarus TaxID=94130 RepID=A0A8H3L9X9_9GLOM|nr:hypothetical protein GLOIN_2v1483996 [Rhizophagus clarus]
MHSAIESHKRSTCEKQFPAKKLREVKCSIRPSIFSIKSWSNHVPSEITAKADIHTDYDKVYYDGEAYFDDPIFQSEKVTNEEAPKVLDKVNDDCWDWFIFFDSRGWLMCHTFIIAGKNCYQKKDSVGTTDTVTIYKRIYEDVSSAVNDRDKLNNSKYRREIYGKRYESFSHLFYEAYDLSKEGDDEIKDNLSEIGEDFGDVTFDEMRWMVIYRSARNKIAHKNKWYPDHRNFHIQHDEALECINLVTGTDAHIFIRRRDLFRSGLEKTINYLYS